MIGIEGGRKVDDARPQKAGARHLPLYRAPAKILRSKRFVGKGDAGVKKRSGCCKAIARICALRRRGDSFRQPIGLPPPSYIGFPQRFCEAKDLWEEGGGGKGASAQNVVFAVRQIPEKSALNGAPAKIAQRVLWGKGEKALS